MGFAHSIIMLTQSYSGALNSEFTLVFLHTHVYIYIYIGAVEYTDCISAEG